MRQGGQETEGKMREGLERQAQGFALDLGMMRKYQWLLGRKVTWKGRVLGPALVHVCDRLEKNEGQARGQVKVLLDVTRPLEK